MKDFLEPLSLPVIIQLIVWAVMVIVFYKSYFEHKDDIYNNLKGKDGVWQPIELSAWLWVKLAPAMLFFTVLAFVFHPDNLTLILTPWTAINGVFTAAIIRKGSGGGDKPSKPSEDETR